MARLPRPDWTSPRHDAQPAEGHRVVVASVPTRGLGSVATVGGHFHGPRTPTGRALPFLLAGVALLLSSTAAVAQPRRPSTTHDEAAAAPFALLSTKRILSYPYEHVWPASIRYLRVDRGFKIADKDEEAGYIMFEFTSESGESGSGSLELVRTEDPAGRPSTSLVANTNGGPSYLSNSLLDGVASKVREERGPPAVPPKKAPPEPPPPPPEIDPDGPKGEEPGYPPGPPPKEKGRKGRR